MWNMPAEWSAHEGTWFSWPHSVDTWPEELPAVERALAGAVAALSRGETVHIGTLDEAHRAHVGRVLLEAGASRNVVLHLSPTNDAWSRDHGAIFVYGNEGQRAATVWAFTSWGGKYPHDLDAQVSRRMAALFNAPMLDGGMVLEGGAIDTNGEGVFLTTKACLLNPNRNPHLSQADIEARMAQFLGAKQIIWLGDGIVGDDTDGHVDDLTRFVSRDTVVTVVEGDRTDENYLPLAENLEFLHQVRLPDGQPLKIIELPMPKPVITRGERLPASYANFYIGNEVVLLPVFDDPADAVAQATLAPLFPSRTIVPVPARDIVWGLGTLHCLSQQIPR